MIIFDKISTVLVSKTPSKRIHSEPDRNQSKLTVCSGQSGELPFSCKQSADVFDSVF